MKTNNNIISRTFVEENKLSMINTTHLERGVCVCGGGGRYVIKELGMDK